jgi:hypothetical protein
MSDEVKTVMLVAVERGFLNGRMVEPGASFEFTGKKLPKWAKPKEEARKALAEKAAKVKAFDTKPAETKSAVQQKAAQLGGNSLA